MITMLYTHCVTDKPKVIINVEITQCNNPLIIQQVIAPPTSMKLLREVKLPSHPHSVCQHGEVTYTGLENNSVMKISRDDVSQFVKLGHWGSSVCVHQDLIYVLMARIDEIRVYNLSGELVRSWNHTSNSRNFNKLRIMGDKVVVPDGTKKSLTVYSLDGKLTKDIPCHGVRTASWKAMAVCGDNSVVVSDYDSGSVFRVDIDSGEVMWTSKQVTRPQGVVCYKNRHVLITNENSDTRIWIVDVDTGECSSL